MQLITLCLVFAALLVHSIIAAPTFEYPNPFDLSAEHDWTTPKINKRNAGGVRLSDEENFAGHVWYGVWPEETCIGLGQYTGNVLSFRPDAGTWCLLMQGRCNSETDYTDVHYNSTYVGNLSFLPWIKNATSYMCMPEPTNNLTKRA